jgi:hypothetical protein
MALARKYSGLAVIWEHRFYGQSLPFESDTVTGYALAGQSAYKYLTNEQALEDTVYFAQNFKPPILQQQWGLLSPSQTPWVFIGGSYPGTSSFDSGRRLRLGPIATGLKQCLVPAVLPSRSPRSPEATVANDENPCEADIPTTCRCSSSNDTGTKPRDMVRELGIISSSRGAGRHVGLLQSNGRGKFHTATEHKAMRFGNVLTLIYLVDDTQLLGGYARSYRLRRCHPRQRYRRRDC